MTESEGILRYEAVTNFPISSLINSKGENIDLSKYNLTYESDRTGISALGEVLFHALKRIEALENKLEELNK